MRKNDSTDIKSYRDLLRLPDGKFIFWRLLHTVELDDYWNAYINEHPEQRGEIDKAIALCDSISINSSHEKLDTESLFQRITATVSERQHRRTRQVRLIRFLSAAAAILLLLLPLGYMTYRQLVPQNKLLGEDISGSDIELLIGSDKVILEDSVSIRVMNDRIICGEGNKRVALMTRAGDKCKLVVPHGKHSFLTLPDQSKVWINSNTQMAFATAFEDCRRDIALDGEIFIDVTHHPERPFTVHASNMDVTVHGTSFNVNAYHGEAESSVVLVRGKVSVSSHDGNNMMLLPGDRAVLSNDNLSKERVDVTEYTTWKDGYLTFHNASLLQIITKVEKYYNLCFDHNYARLSTKRISGKLSLSNNVDDMLSTLSILAEADYTRTNNIVKFKMKKKGGINMQ